MASAKTKATENNKRLEKSPAQKAEKQLVTFTDIRQGYIPGEQILLRYNVDPSYTLRPKDSVVLQKCGTESCSEKNPYRWPVSQKRHRDSYRTRLGLPNPDRRAKMNEYQFVYQSFESDSIIGRSRTFMISDIVELEDVIAVCSGLEGAMDVTNIVDRELFEETVTQPRPMLLYDVKRKDIGLSAVALQADHHTELSQELKTVLRSDVSAESIVRVAELIKQYERIYGIPQDIRESKPQSKPQPLVQVVTQSNVQTQVAEFLHKVERKRDTSAVVGSQLSSAEVEFMNDGAFLDSFVFPYISGVFEYLTNDGYTRIICRNSRVVLLDAYHSGRTLDLRRRWNPNSTTDVIELPRSSPQHHIDNISTKCMQLSEELQFLKRDSTRTHTPCITEMRRSQAIELEELEGKIDTLQEQITSIRAGKGKDALDEVALYQTRKVSSDAEIANLKDLNKAFAGRVEILESKLAEKTEEYEILHELFVSQSCCLQHNDSVEMLRKSDPCKRSKLYAQAKRKTATSTERVDTEEESTTADSEHIRKMTAFPRPPVVQKATSYAASTTHDAAASDGKPTTTSDRNLSVTFTSGQKSWLELLKQLLNPHKPVKRIADRQVKALPPAAGKDSTESLAVAMRRLFNMYSSPSLASTNTSDVSIDSTDSIDSINTAVRDLFASDSSICDTSKTGTYPVTPCNSAGNVPRVDKARTRDMKQSTSMRDMLRKLFGMDGEELKTGMSGASEESISSLGEAMRQLFKETISSTDVENRKCELSTSNDSLSQAMHWLFERLSEHSLAEDDSASNHLSDSASSTSSLGSVLLWGLAESAPEQFKNLDVKAYNQDVERKRKQKKSADSKVECECHIKMSSDLADFKNPHLASVIRSFSPDRDVNISFPSKVPAANQTAVKEDEPNGKAAKFTFTSLGGRTVLDSGVRRLSAGRRSRARKIRKSTMTCPHCNITFQSNCVGQSVFRMRKHIRSVHEEEE